jgi:RHS repeat-associated protein
MSNRLSLLRRDSSAVRGIATNMVGRLALGCTLWIALLVSAGPAFTGAGASHHASASLGLRRTFLKTVGLMLLVLYAGFSYAQQTCSYSWYKGTSSGGPVGQAYPSEAAVCSATSFSVPGNTIIFSPGAVDDNFGGGSIYYCAALETLTPTPTSDCGNGVCGTFFSEYGALVSIVPSTTCPKHWVVATPPPRAEVCSANCVGDPINPGIGNVFLTETDIKFRGGASPIAFQRFYSSADPAGSDNVTGWRHSYDRYINIVYETPPSPYPGQSATVSPQYATAEEACTEGFAAIQSSVAAWAAATAAYSGGVCVLSNGSATIATLPIQSDLTPVPPTNPVEYDLVRDDGQILRYTLQNGTINNQPGSSIQLEVTGSGFTVTDADDNVEVYNAAGALQTITSRAGVVQTVSYDSNGWFSGVTDSFGNGLTVTRSSSESIGSVSVTGGGTVQYGYGTYGNLPLSTVTNLDGTNRSYTYGNSAFGNALTSETDESSVQFSSWTYDSQERAIATQEAGGADAETIVYNADGSVTTTDALGAVRAFQHTRVGDINRVAGISGSQCPTCQESAATSYDSAGWVASRTDYNGNVTCYSNDPVRGLELVRVEGFAPGSTCPSNLAGYTPASGGVQRKISTIWGSAYRLPTLITEATRTTSFVYDGSGNLKTRTVTDTTVTPNVSRTWSYTYNSFGQVLTAQGPRTDVNSTRTYTYYTCTSGVQCGQVQTVTDALGHVTTFNTYNAYGQPLTITDPNNVVTTFAYDARQRLTSKSIGGETTTFSYFPTGLTRQITFADGSFLAYTYDGAHRLTTVRDSLGNSVQYTLDALGNHTVESAYDPSNTLALTRSHVYNSLSQLYQDIPSAGTAAVTTTYGYDLDGNRLSSAAPLGRTTTNTYDALNRISTVKDPGNGVTQFAYDANNNLTSVTDPMGFVTSYVYDGLSDTLQQSSPDSGTTTRTYDSAGNVHTSTDANGSVTTYTYDSLNRLITATSVARLSNVWPGTVNYGYSYDNCLNGSGRLCGATGPVGTMAWTYTPQGRVASRTELDSWSDSGSYPLTYTYNAGGQITSLTYPSGAVLQYTYNGNNQIASISVTVDGATTPIVTNVQYEPFGAVSGWTWGNGATAIRLHNADGNISAINTTGLGLTYGYDNALRATEIGDQATPSLSWSYGYDTLDRLTSATNANTNEAWTYDANGNRLTETGGPNANEFTYSSTSNRNSSPLVTYDADGNLLSAPGQSEVYYDAAKNISDAGEPVATNALRQRVANYDSGRTLWDDAGHIIGEYEWGGSFQQLPNSVVPVQETVYLGDLPVATLVGQITSDPEGNLAMLHPIYYVHADHLNTPRRVTQPSTNSLAWRWDSDPFGNGNPNMNPSGGASLVYDLRFPGQVYDALTGDFNNWHRDYNAPTCRYIESDPIGLAGGVNTYAYANGDPISEIDPLGLWGFGDPLPQGVVDYSAGLGDTLSFGLTNQIRNATGTNGVVNKCSGAYTAGQVSAVALDVAIGGAAGLEAAEANAGEAGYEFSHWIPNRFGGPRSLWNGNYVSQEFHYLTDPFRYPPGWQQYGDKLPALLQQLGRIPWVYPGAAAGGAVGAASAASQSCGCQQ